MYICQVMAIQALGGTGALRLGADLLFTQCGRKIVYLTDPTWGLYIFPPPAQSHTEHIVQLLKPHTVRTAETENTVSLAAHSNYLSLHASLMTIVAPITAFYMIHSRAIPLIG